MIGNKYKYGLIDMSYLLSRNVFACSRKGLGQFDAGDVIKMTLQTLNKLPRDFGITVDKYILVRDTWAKEYGGYYRTYILGGKYKDSRVYMTDEMVEEMKRDPSKTEEEIKKAELDAYINKVKREAKNGLIYELNKFGVPCVGVSGWEYDAVIIFSTRAKDQEGTQRQGIEKLSIKGCCSKYIEGKNEEDRQYGILSVVNSPKVRIRDFLISNVDVGIKLKGAWTGFIENSYWLSCHYRAIYIYSESQGLTIKNINTASTREVGIEVRGGAYCNLISVLVEWVYGGIAYKFDSSQINMLGCGYELTNNMTCGIHANRSRIQLTSAFLEGGTSQADGYKMINLNDSFLEVITGSIGYSEQGENITSGCLFVVGNKSKITHNFFIHNGS